MIPEIRPGGRPDGSALGDVERAALLGADVDHPEIKQARAHAEHARTIAEDAATLRAMQSTAHAEDMASRYHAGKLTLPKMLTEIATAEAAGTPLAGRVLASAQAKASSAAGRSVAALGDRWVTEILRPVVERILEPLPELAEILPPLFVSKMDTMKLGRETEISRQSREVRDAWFRYSDLVTDLTAVHDLADGMRMAGIIPVRTRRPSEDFRWRHLDRLSGRADAVYSFLLTGYANGAEPGIYTEAEVEAALEDVATRQAREDERRQAQADAQAQARAESKARLRVKRTPAPAEADQSPPAA